MNRFLTQYFSTNHQRLELFFIAYRRHLKSDRDFALALFNKFKRGMVQQMHWEEQFLIPALSEAGPHNGRFAADKAKQEHQQIRAQVEKIVALQQQGLDSHQEDQVLEFMLSDHFENDEFNFYPVCDRLFDTDTRIKLLMAMDNDSAALCG
ncbi:hemerythrin domain-containing protein [Aliiglaciecola sp. CAU 1673]|uniref:hemerythrin domain-containing protein n=1 Tax=Aliiglaciecola sp. CAU 1673 TaxID=3032595 RepID=UPI0023DB4560|nr:hemerythrin domain-containing protein [Aliiglaciecola sp. CAU 1673]MDF2180171.1 hemerythrin domain-containing protein [Aliiglaciecola sp. CAU 1673]